MQVSAEHRKYLRASYLPHPRVAGHLSEGQRAILRRYGAWLQALENGTIEPLTPAQHLFLEASRKGANTCMGNPKGATWLYYRYLRRIFSVDRI